MIYCTTNRQPYIQHSEIWNLHGHLSTMLDSTWGKKPRQTSFCFNMPQLTASLGPISRQNPQRSWAPDSPFNERPSVISIQIPFLSMSCPASSRGTSRCYTRLSELLAFSLNQIESEDMIKDTQASVWKCEAMISICTWRAYGCSRESSLLYWRKKIKGLCFLCK